MYFKRIHNVCGYFDKGYYTQVYDANLAYCPYGSCGVRFDADENSKIITLVSYDTEVIYLRTYYNGKREIMCTGTYSQTTRKHIGAFLKEFAPELSYYDMKKIAYTGKILEF